MEPYGFCGGVKRALETAYRAKEAYPTKQIYLIGALVHNENVIGKLRKDGFFLFDGDVQETIGFLSSLPFGSVICFSAHGHPAVYEAVAKKREAIVYDATCPYVKKNEADIQKSLSLGRHVLFIGKRGHAEALSALSLDAERVSLFDEELPLEPLRGEKVSVFSQTTMSEREVLHFAEKAKRELSSSADISASRCLDAKRRQEAIVKMKEADAFVVLGSSNSNNSKELLSIAKRHFPNKPCYLALSKDELLGVKFDKRVHSVALISGASTSQEDVLAAKGYLESL